MKDEIIDVEFTAPVRDFLERRKYSHILSVGIDPNEQNDAQEPETGRKNYWLEPLKPDDPRLGYQETEQIINEISHPDVIEMPTTAKDTRFMIRVPVIDYNDYLKDR